MITYSISYYEQ